MYEQKLKAVITLINEEARNTQMSWLLKINPLAIARIYTKKGEW